MMEYPTPTIISFGLVALCLIGCAIDTAWDYFKQTKVKP